jgi:hypothetical protein
VKARELDDSLGYLYSSPVNVFGVGGHRQSAINHDIASFGDGLQDSVTETVPRVNVEPYSFYSSVLEEYSFTATENLTNLLSPEDLAKGSLPTCPTILIELFVIWHIQCVLVLEEGRKRQPHMRFCCCMAAKRPLGFVIAASKDLRQLCTLILAQVVATI